jgi:hypothetical protein
LKNWSFLSYFQLNLFEYSIAKNVNLKLYIFSAQIIQYVPGVNLAKRAEGGLSVETALEIVQQLLDTLRSFKTEKNLF